MELDDDKYSNKIDSIKVKIMWSKSTFSIQIQNIKIKSHFFFLEKQSKITNYSLIEAMFRTGAL